MVPATLAPFSYCSLSSTWTKSLVILQTYQTQWCLPAKLIIQEPRLKCISNSLPLPLFLSQCMNTSYQVQKCAIWKWLAGCNYCTETIDKLQHSEKKRFLYSRKFTLVELLLLQRKDLGPTLKGKCWAKKELKPLWKDNWAGSTLGFLGKETFCWGKASFRLTEEIQNLDFKDFSQHLEVAD